MAVVTANRLLQRRRTKSLSVVLCGSYRRDPDGLARVYSTLSELFEVVSPRSLDFVDSDAEFVRLQDEVELTEAEIEQRHLAAIVKADFVWLHAPGGYVGASASLELGHASALGVPVLVTEMPREQTFAWTVTQVDSPRLVDRPFLNRIECAGQGLGRLQSYYDSAASRRSWNEEQPEKILTLLYGEVAELEKAVRLNQQGVSRTDNPDADVAAELADVQLYVIHLANKLGIDISEAVSAKERINADRFEINADTHVA